MPRVSDFLVPLLEDYGLYHRCLESSALHLWPVVVGPQVALCTEAERVRDGVLMVRTMSSAWAHELALGFRTVYLEKLNARLGKPVLRDIRFLPPPLRKKTAATPEVAAPISQPPTPEEAAWIAQQLEGVDDPDLARRLDRVLRRDLARRKGRVQAGWLPCPVCQQLSVDGRTCAPCVQILGDQRRGRIRQMLMATPWLSALDIKALVPDMKLSEYQKAKGHVLQGLRRELLAWCARNPLPAQFDAVHQQNALWYTMLRCGKMPHKVGYADVRRALRDELAGRFPLPKDPAEGEA